MLVVFGRWIALLVYINLISCGWGVIHDGLPSQNLFVAEEPVKNQRTFLINLGDDPESSHLERRKRDTSTSLPAALQKNISTWTTHLNDSHQQLMVHWVGEGSNVIICLARDSTPKNKAGAQPSALYISYDYGKNFTNKTENFKLSNEPNSGYAQLDKFFNHPKYPEFCVFVDATNKKLYYTTDNGRNIYRSDLNFSPSELAFDEEHPDKFVVLDKVDSNRKLFLTLDGGKTFKHIQSYVKTFFWSSGVDFEKTFYVERWKPDGTSSVFAAPDPVDLEDGHKIFDDAKDFQIKGDFMFATKQSKEKKTLDLYISHQRGPFFKAEFQTELDLRKFHIADVTDKRIFVSVLHRENLADLYVSEIGKNFTHYYFVLSMEQILCYFPDGNWKDSWLEDVTEDPFTDLYRVEGLKGIYIASRVDSRAPVSNIGPEHLISLITFDHGVTWSPINPPTEDENGKPLNCHIENSCSLHLCQKFSQLYPVTRSASIMSSKSAPGMIMATGVMGKSLKGIPGVYVSRDAGLTWRRILKEYYFFNYGDHGGVLVAVKYFKVRGETRHILYSTDEGLTWNSYEFNANDLRIYGLMTEPGENTTTFTMFGSANDQHQWIIITIDLQNAFARNCKDDDYKFWSPAPPNSSISCVLGSRSTFQRRLAHTNCYNGKDYDRPVKKQLCECSRRDYECDFGFMLSGNQCIRNRTDKFDPYAIPPDCQPGHFYERTKGYRKIDGDECVATGYIAFEPDTIPCPLEEPQEFILVALRDRIARINLADNSSVIPVRDQKNIVAIEFDIKNNCIYWADIEVDKISRQCFNDGTSQEVVVDTDLASIEGMALDYISNVLFFVDGMRKKIEAVRTDLTSQGRMRVTILDNKTLYKPRGIAVHPRAGYLFWTDWDRNNPSVSRSNLDGTNVKRLFKKPLVQWPNGITIDQMSEKVYWVDAMEDYIACTDLDGKYFKKILWNDEKVSHPFAVAVLKDKMFWDDWKAKSIFIADKDTGGDVITINNSFSGLMDLKVFAHFVQHGSNACSYKTTNCDALCLGAPGNGFSCLCPDGFTRINNKCMCHNGLPPAANMTCPKKNGGSCDQDQFTCKNGMCIASAWRCDGNNDCGDLSDEMGCQCQPPMITCDNTRCYLPHWKCDGEFDCNDKSDEQDCGVRGNCTASQFRCADGQCVEERFVCDGDNDCKDGSDESNCSTVIQPKRPDTVNCSVNGFSCTGAEMCIPEAWVCDGERDCPAGDDESPAQCANSTCASYMFRCPSGKCIYNTWVCDGENDCSDDESSDEKNCTSTGQGKVIPRPANTKPSFPGSCHDWMFTCDNGNCLPYWWRCDNIDDCGDGTDERGCHMSTSVTAPPRGDSKNSNPTRPPCTREQFTCPGATCIPLSWVCDSTEDCDDGSDERGCPHTVAHNRTCRPQDLPCRDGKCVAPEKICDGYADCSDAMDELHCTKPERRNLTCSSNQMKCDDGLLCLPWEMICNNIEECYDGSDEKACTDSYSGRFGLHVERASVNESSFSVSWWGKDTTPRTHRYLPAIASARDGRWTNQTWTDDYSYRRFIPTIGDRMVGSMEAKRFTGLEAFTTYNVTAYLFNLKSNKTFASHKYITVTTREGVPSPPLRLTVRQQIGSRVNVVWDPPATPRGLIRRYTLFFSPPVPPMAKVFTAKPNATMSVFVDGFFLPNVNYSLWVTASNGEHTSVSSDVAVLQFDPMSDVDALDIVNASIARPSENSVLLQWHQVRNVDGYIVKPRLPDNYVEWPQMKTNKTEITINDLPPGVTVIFEVMAYKNSVIGRPMSAKIQMSGVQHETLKVNASLTKPNSVRVAWEPPTSDRYKGKDLEYVVVYKKESFTGSKEVANLTQISTHDTSVVIERLSDCEAYLFSAGMRGGPIAPYIDLVTGADPRSPVKTLHTFFDPDTKKLDIRWNANCDMVRQPTRYRLDIHELTRNKNDKFVLAQTKNASLSHVIENVHLGGRYNICIQSTVEGATPLCRVVRSGALPAPEAVMAWQAPNGHLLVTWHHDHTDSPTHKYEVLISDKDIPDDILTPDETIQVRTAENPPVMIESPGGGKRLYVAVRALTDDGYYSDISEVQSMHMTESEETRASVSGAVWGGILGAVALVAVCGALVHAALRYRRVARSFLPLGTHTTRYDSRRGHATISEHDDDDVPPIHGFSDDEPLVIA